LLTGVSAGGSDAGKLRASGQKVRHDSRFCSWTTPGPPMDAPYVPALPCDLYSQTWGLDKTVQVDCGSDCPDTSHLLIDFLKHVSRGYPNIPFGLVDSIGDWVISAFFGYGGSDCTSFALLSEATFAAGLQDIKAQMAGQSNFGAFVFLEMTIRRCSTHRSSIRESRLTRSSRITLRDFLPDKSQTSARNSLFPRNPMTLRASEFAFANSSERNFRLGSIWRLKAAKSENGVRYLRSYSRPNITGSFTGNLVQGRHTAGKFHWRAVVSHINRRANSSEPSSLGA